MAGSNQSCATRRWRFPVFGKWVSVMVFSVFGDEGADETKQRVFAVSGLCGTETEWQKADSAWTEATRGEVFHAADWEHAGRKDEYKTLVKVLTASPVAGVAYTLDLAAFDRVYPDTLREAAYLKCFTKVVTGIAANVERFNQQSHASEITKVEYKFDNRPEIEVQRSPNVWRVPGRARMDSLIIARVEGVVRLQDEPAHSDGRHDCPRSHEGLGPQGWPRSISRT